MDVWCVSDPVGRVERIFYAVAAISLLAALVVALGVIILAAWALL